MAAAAAIEKSERAEERGSVAGSRQTLPTSPGKVFDVDDEFSHFRRRNAAPLLPRSPLSPSVLFSPFTSRLLRSHSHFSFFC